MIPCDGQNRCQKRSTFEYKTSCLHSTPYKDTPNKTHSYSPLPLTSVECTPRTPQRKKKNTHTHTHTHTTRKLTPLPFLFLSVQQTHPEVSYANTHPVFYGGAYTLCSPISTLSYTRHTVTRTINHRRIEGRGMICS